MIYEQSIQKKLEDAIEQIRPNIQMDGGDIELVKYEDGIVYIRLLGACVGCPISTYTVKLGVEEAIRNSVPEIQEVVRVD